MQQNMRPITKPDLNSVFESMLPLAKSNPQYINAYLLTGTPEQKLAAAMIKDMPQSPTLPAQTQAPTQTVIDQKLAQAEPGIAALPVAESMFDGGTYAAGGIVAFEEGGSIYKQLYGQEPDQFGNIIIGDKLVNIRDLQLGRELSPVKTKKPLAAQQKVPTSPWDMSIPMGAVSEETKPKSALLDPINWGVPTQQAEAAVRAPQIQKPLAAKPTIDPNKKAIITDPAAAPTDAQLPQNVTKQQMAPTIGSKIGDNFGLTSIDPNKYLPKKETMTDIEKEQADAYARAGVTDKPYEAGLKDLISRREKLAKSEEQAPWMALAKAGFAMASGKSQFGLQNLAEGAGVGLADLTAAKDKLETRRDQLEDKEQAYTLAQNQYMQNRTDANLSRARSSKENYEKAQQGLEVANNNIVNEGKKLALNVELEKIKLNSSNFNAAQSRELQRLQLEKPDAFSVMLEAVNSDPALKTKMQRAERLVEMTKKAASGSEGYTLQASIGKGVDDMFKDRSTPLGKLYSAIANNNKDQLKELGYTGKTGLAAANAYKDTYRQQQLDLYGPRGSKAGAGSVVDFNSLG